MCSDNILKTRFADLGVVIVGQIDEHQVSKHMSVRTHDCRYIGSTPGHANYYCSIR